MTTAGQLRHKVKLQKPERIRDPAGQPIDGWATIAEPWADIKHLSGLATIKAGADTSIVKASIRIRYRPGVVAGMRVLHGDAAYKVNAPMAVDGKREFIDLVCEVINVQT